MEKRPDLGYYLALAPAYDIVAICWFIVIYVREERNAGQSTRLLLFIESFILRACYYARAVQNIAFVVVNVLGWNF